MKEAVFISKVRLRGNLNGSLFNFEGPGGTSGRRGKLLFFLDGEAEASREDAGKRIADQISNIRHPTSKWGCSSAGRAPALQAGGHRFEPVHLHQGPDKGRRPNVLANMGS